MFHPRSIRGSLLFLLALSTAASRSAAADRPNVLFIAVDDLRPELGCYGAAHIHSPNLDRLAREGVQFNRAYCQQAVCNASRASVHTGLRPDSAKVWDLIVHFRDVIPDVVALPQHFRDNGYYTVAYGKLYHNPLPDRRSWDEPNHWALNAETWSRAGRDQLAEYRKQMQADGKTEYAINRMRAPATDDEDVPDSARPDGDMVEQAIAKLGELSRKDQPFFLGMGFIRPHLPFTPPKKYWDLYDRAAIPLASNPFLPGPIAPYSMDNMYELRDYCDFAESPQPFVSALTEDQQRLLRHGYFASVSSTDALVGRLLDELDRLGLADDTIVMLWSDHGWKLGEHRSWCKQTNFEIDARVPLLVRAPGAAGNGRPCDALIELVDMYPTLCELCGLETPAHVEGTSFAPLLTDPAAPGPAAAFSQFLRRYENRQYMGYAMRTDRYRLVDWIDWETGESTSVELYDHQTDPEENHNVVAAPENASLLEQLRQQLRATTPPRKLQPGNQLHSMESKEPAKLTFANSSKEPVTIYWLDLRGGRQQPKELPPGEEWTTKTFLGHVFVAETKSGGRHWSTTCNSADQRVRLE